MSRFSVSVIVTTFNSPATLRLVLLGLVRQTVLPAEVLVVDDGSEHETAELLNQMALEMPFSLVHVWQPHDGFRAARSRNNGISRARGDVLAFLDQDTIPHARWLDIHTSGLGPRDVSLGDVIPLDRDEASAVTDRAVRQGRFEQIFTFRNRRRLLWLHVRYLLYAALRRQGAPIKTKPRLRSCNFALMASVMREINGFDETYVGWGQEDDDLGRRLYKLGIQPRVRVIQARVSHLPHPPRRPADWREGHNVRRYDEGLNGSARCEVGVSRHPYPDVRVKLLSP
jgi:glycosyltransferase involved in cell wall biosynthesis